ncbi:latrophilin-like protein 1 isoform X2 [Montipora foliosa]|uniref:latrophilin-like protein 1 isoform X2 n=1 Tax=Montipora foliosa TaxID=591990 RepID=UPI0035F2165B
MPSSLKIDCSYGSSRSLRTFGSSPSSPPLTILFDFTSSFENRVTVKERKMQFERNINHVWYCAANELYDPYIGKCKSTVSLHVHPQQTDTPISQSENTVPVDFISNETRLLLNLNCTFVPFNQSDYEGRPNGTVYIKPHHKIYEKTRYTIRGNILLLCVNFSRNETVFSELPSAGYLNKTTPTSLQIMTFTGCITSMASLLLLLAKYALFSELRNLPGRIIINLSLSLLFYQGVFLAAMKTYSHEQCQAIAILLHYLVLCSFTWMNAMAYDVHKTFTSSDGGRGSNRQGNHNKRLVRYCLYGWGVPAILVSLFVIIDQILMKGFIGYGDGEAYCFISKPNAVLYFFVAPIALIMLFNTFALVHTVLHIVKTRKRTPKVTNQRNSTEVALICVKIASVMGVTWILGIAANVQALSLLWYPFVVLNSLQGGP